VVLERRSRELNYQIEPKRIDRLSNIVETTTFGAAEFFGLYAEEHDEEFGESYWIWVSDHPTIASAYSHSVRLGDSRPSIRAIA
jgi:hypothetical protein